MARINSPLLKGARGRFAGSVLKAGPNGTTQIANIPASVANPKTNGQLYQRAIIATIMKAYSAGKMIFDHAFQGKKVGSENQQYFMSLNARRLRMAIANDIANNKIDNTSLGRVVAPKSLYPVPFSYQVSEGTLINPIEKTYSAGHAQYRLPSITGNETTTVGEYMSKNFALDDLLTLVIFNAFPHDVEENIVFKSQLDDVLADQVRCNFIYVRFAPKPEAFESTALITDAVMSDMFQVTEANVNVPTSFLSESVDEVIEYDSLVESPEWCATAIIYSKVNQDLRSTEVMQMNRDANDLTDGYGIISANLIYDWKQGASHLGDSILILEGGMGK